MSLKLLAAAIGIAGFCPNPSIAASLVTPLFGAYFDGDKNLQLVATADGANWTTIKADAYAPPSGDLRDPSIIQIGSTLWICYTSGVFGAVNYFSIIKSTDGGSSWSFVRDVVTVPGADYTWGPEWFLDADGSLHVTVGVSTNGVGSDSNMHMYELHPTTSDPAGVWSSATSITMTDAALPVYDNQVVLEGNVYHAIITVAGFGFYDFSSNTLLGPYTIAGGGGFTFNGSPLYGVEAPDVFPLPQGGYGIVFMGANGLAFASSLGDLHTWSATQPIHCTGGASVNNGGHFIPIAELALATAVSRKVHGLAGTFDIDLPLDGEPGVECRSGGSDGDHMLVITFNNTVVNGKATIVSGIGSLAGSPIFDADTLTVNLTGVADAQRVIVTLSNVTDSFGQVVPDKAVNVNMLIGDTNGNRTVNAGDVAQARGQSGLPVTVANFRSDVNTNGMVNAGDVSLIKASAGHSVP